jgi:branched-chain amino acid transport system ATP-binding protein
MDAILSIHDLTMDFGGLRALDGVDLDAARGDITALIGPNGAGKTTLFDCITGIYPPTCGDISLTPASREKTSLTGLLPNKVTEKGVARTFQNIRLFYGMTVLENVMMGRHCRTHSGIIGAFLRGPATRKEEEETAARSFRVLERFGLQSCANLEARALPYGLARRLEIARALATEPLLLHLDEPAAGMNPQETKDLDDLIRRIRDEHALSILLIEHDMNLVMGVSDRIVVLEHGRKIAQGNPAEIRQNQEVIRAYLGDEDGLQ